MALVEVLLVVAMALRVQVVLEQPILEVAAVVVVIIMLLLLLLAVLVVQVIAVLDTGHRRNNGTFCRDRFR
jgi:hypothetical protein